MHPLAPQLIFLLNTSPPTSDELDLSPLKVELRCEVAGVDQEAAEAAILAEVDEFEGLGVEAVLVCAGPGEVVVHLSRDLQNASTTIDLSAFPRRTRARALALSVAEAIPLLTPSESAPEAEPVVLEEDAPLRTLLPIAAEDAPPGMIEDLPPPRVLPKVQIHIGSIYRGYFNGDQQGGGKVSVAIDGFEMGVHALAGKKDGGARGAHMGGQIGYDFLYKPYLPARPVLGLETSLGHSDSGDFSSAYGAGMSYLGVNGPIGKEWRYTFRGEAGYSFRGTTATPSRFSGGFVGASLILGAAPEYHPPQTY